MPVNAASGVGKLRRVLVHQPGLEHTRLPRQRGGASVRRRDLGQAGEQEHDAFVEVMRDRGIEVFYAEELLTDVLGIPSPRLDHRSGAGREARGPETRPLAAGMGADHATPRRWPTT